MTFQFIWTHNQNELSRVCTFPSKPLMAAEASSVDVKVTNPNPLDLPVSLSMITRAAQDNACELICMKRKLGIDQQEDYHLPSTTSP